MYINRMIYRRRCDIIKHSTLKMHLKNNNNPLKILDNIQYKLGG